MNKTEEVARKLMQQDSMNDDWYFDNAESVKEAQETCQEYLDRANQIRQLFEPKPIEGKILGFKKRPDMVFPPEYYEEVPKPDETAVAHGKQLVQEAIGKPDESRLRAARDIKGIRTDLLALLKDAGDLRTLERQLVEYVESLKEREGIT